VRVARHVYCKHFPPVHPEAGEDSDLPLSHYIFIRLHCRLVVRPIHEFALNMQSQPTDLLSLCPELFLEIARHLEPFDLVALDESCKAMRSATSNAYQHWYIKDLPASEVVNSGTADWKQLALARYRRHHCGDFDTCPSEALNRAWLCYPWQHHRHQLIDVLLAPKALAARVWMYLRDHQRSDWASIWEKTRDLATASVILGNQERAFQLYRQLLSQQASIPDDSWRSFNKTRYRYTAAPRRDQLPDSTWWAVVRSPQSVPKVIYQYLRPLNEVDVFVRNVLMDASVITGDTITMEQLRLTALRFGQEHACRAVSFSQIRVLEYLRSTCGFDLDPCNCNNGSLIDCALARGVVVAVVYLYSIGFRARRSHLKIAARHPDPDVSRAVTAALASQTEATSDEGST
jgi:hypothetical protein